MVKTGNSILLTEYMRWVKPTDKLPKDEITPVLLGLFGEVGSIMATAKKSHREKEAFAGYQRAAIEEFGDALWYLAALCRRLKVSLDSLFADGPPRAASETAAAATDIAGWPVALARRLVHTPDLDAALLKLGEAAAALLSLAGRRPAGALRAFADCYVVALQAAGMTFAQVVEHNIAKTTGRFLDPNPATLPTFDDRFDEEERLPERFEIEISQRKSGQCYLRWNGVFIGDPLTDNIPDRDGYRFHDVFHFAHASVLHWSPTFRALIKQKRKSDKEVDETQDGGRAIVVEEGLTAWIFSRAKELRFFENQKGVSFDLLKTVQQFVRGYEVQECPLRLWEDAILQGYAIFRQVHANNGGTVIGDRKARRVTYKAPKGSKA